MSDDTDTEDNEGSSQDSPHTGAADREKQRLRTSPRFQQGQQQSKSKSSKPSKSSAKRALPVQSQRPPLPPKRKATGVKGTSKKRSKKVVKEEVVIPKTTAARYSTIEDVCLAQAWISASEDPVVGANRTGSTYWKEVKKKFEILYAESDVEVKQQYDFKSLNNRWNRHINNQVQLFLQYWKAASTNPPSGTVEADWIEAAMESYLAEEGRPFKFKECFLLLKDHPKFDGSNNLQEEEQAAANLDNRNNTAPAMAAGQMRPIGQKKAKAMRRSSASDSESSQAIARLAETQAQLNSVLSLRDQRKAWTNLASMYIQLGDTTQAKYYMDLLSSSAAPTTGPPSIINTTRFIAPPPASTTNDSLPNPSSNSDRELTSPLPPPLEKGKTTGLYSNSDSDEQGQRAV